MRTHQGTQWRKWRSPVKTIARPSSSARSMLASSRIAPPGWTIDGDARRGRGLDAVGERIERVARARAARRPPGGLLRRDLARLDPVLLPGTDADRLAVLHEHDRVRLHVPADPPRELDVAPLGVGGHALGDHLPVVACRREVVRLLHQEAHPRSGARRSSTARGRVPRAAACSCAWRQRLDRSGLVRRRDHDVGLRSGDHALDRRGVDRAVQRDDPAERRPLVALERALVRRRRGRRRSRRRTGSRA